jgi:hypothetical protein
MQEDRKVKIKRWIWGWEILSRYMFPLDRMCTKGIFLQYAIVCSLLYLPVILDS